AGRLSLRGFAPAALLVLASRNRRYPYQLGGVRSRPIVPRAEGCAVLCRLVRYTPGSGAAAGLSPFRVLFDATYHRGRHAGWMGRRRRLALARRLEDRRGGAPACLSQSLACDSGLGPLALHSEQTDRKPGSGGRGGAAAASGSDHPIERRQ